MWGQSGHIWGGICLGARSPHCPQQEEYDHSLPALLSSLAPLLPVSSVDGQCESRPNILKFFKRWEKGVGTSAEMKMCNHRFYPPHFELPVLFLGAPVLQVPPPPLLPTSAPHTPALGTEAGTGVSEREGKPPLIVSVGWVQELPRRAEGALCTLGSSAHTGSWVSEGSSTA